MEVVHVHMFAQICIHVHVLVAGTNRVVYLPTYVAVHIDRAYIEVIS